jgi:hypothetical protein
MSSFALAYAGMRAKVKLLDIVNLAIIHGMVYEFERRHFINPAAGKETDLLALVAYDSAIPSPDAFTEVTLDGRVVPIPTRFLETMAKFGSIDEGVVERMLDCGAFAASCVLGEIPSPETSFHPDNPTHYVRIAMTHLENPEKEVGSTSPGDILLTTDVPDFNSPELNDHHFMVCVTPAGDSGEPLFASAIGAGSCPSLHTYQEATDLFDATYTWQVTDIAIEPIENFPKNTP